MRLKHILMNHIFTRNLHKLRSAKRRTLHLQPKFKCSGFLRKIKLKIKDVVKCASHKILMTR